MRLAEDFDVCYIDEPLIALASGKVSPHQFADSFSQVQPLLEQMFWEARMRHYQDRPVRRLLEAGRHAGFVAAARAYLLMIRANSAIRGRGRQQS
jgi:hypothetical protein